MDFGFLTDTELKEQMARLLPDTTFDKERASGASYDLTLGQEVYISGREYPDLLSDTNPFVSLPRGQFALLMTKEYVTMPEDHFGLISIKFWKKAQGLINISGFHVDPGFEGNIVFSVFNAGPSDVLLEHGEPMFMIFFYKLQHPAKRYEGKMQRQKRLPTDLVTSLKGTAASLSDVDKRVGRLEMFAWVFLAVLLTLLGAIIAVAIGG